MSGLACSDCRALRANGDDFWMVEKVSDLFLDLMHRCDISRIHKRDELAAGDAKCSVEANCLAVAFFVAKHPDTAVAFAKNIGDFGGVVFRSVINDDDFNSRVCLPEETLHAAGERRSGIVDRDDNGDECLCDFHDSFEAE